jgi:hypothetical protein
LKGLPSRRKQRENDREHVAEKLQRRPPKFNQFSQNGVFGRDSTGERSKNIRSAGGTTAGIRYLICLLLSEHMVGNKVVRHVVANRILQ